MEGSGRLLLVEDETSLRGLVSQFLRLEGYTVIEAADGREAVELLDTIPIATLDVAMVDLNLPEINGIEVCRHARRVQPGLSLVVCSAAIQGEHEQSLRALGVHAFLTKPYHPGHLLSLLRCLAHPGTSVPPQPHARSLGMRDLEPATNLVFRRPTPVP